MFNRAYPNTAIFSTALPKVMQIGLEVFYREAICLPADAWIYLGHSYSVAE